MDIYRKGDGMWEPVQAHLFLEMMLLDSKSFRSNECLPRRSPSETKLQFTFKIFHVLPLCFSYGIEFLVFSKNLYAIFSNSTACELTHSLRLEV